MLHFLLEYQDSRDDEALASLRRACYEIDKILIWAEKQRFDMSPHSRITHVETPYAWKQALESLQHDIYEKIKAIKKDFS